MNINYYDTFYGYRAIEITKKMVPALLALAKSSLVPIKGTKSYKSNRKVNDGVRVSRETLDELTSSGFVGYSSNCTRRALSRNGKNLVRELKTKLKSKGLND
jgi:ribosomal protein S19E (S16A)